MFACTHCGKKIGFAPAGGEVSVECPHCGRRVRIPASLSAAEPPPLPPDAGARARTQADRQVISDVVVGVNLRVRDNLYQGLTILIFVLIGAGLGWMLAGRTSDAALIGAGAGLIVGFLLSGFFLMIYRMIKHD